jgi:D-alanyl-D-alanine carboxypeptidase/D-alanyl-D-alanine-endopeptidase (penicillin-binding protein 4)
MIRGAARVCPRTLGAPIAALLMFACALAGTPALGALPRPVIRAFSQAQVPLASVGIVVQAADAERPLFAHRGDVPMNPASVIKLVTSFAALELLGADYRWRTEAYLDGPLDRGVLRGDLVLKGHGDPKITIEQWQAFMQALRARGLDAVEGDLVLDRSFFAPGDHDPAGFDNEPLRPYNVGADALLVNFKAVKFRFAPDAGGRGVDVGVEPPLSQIAVGPPPAAASGSCGDWRARLGASFANPGPTAQASFAGTYPVSCGERDWWVALLDHPTYIHGMFESYFRAAGGRFDGRWRDGRAPANATPFVVLESMPLYDVVRDVNKLSNNVMARQVFLSLAASHAPPPATTAKATAAVTAWLERRRLRMPELVLDNGSGLSRQERISAGSLARLLRAAAASQVRDDFASSLAVAATDGTLQRRFVDGRVAGQGLLKTGTLDGVRAIAGYVIDSRDRRWIVVALVNHVNAARAQGAIDTLVQWVYTEAALWSPTQQR